MNTRTRALTIAFWLGLITAPAVLAQAAAVAAPAPAEEQSDSIFTAGIQQGTTSAKTVGTGMWTIGGFAGGAFLGPVGAGLAYALATSSASALPAPVVTKIAKRETPFQLGFQQAYTDRLTTKRRWSALIGGVTGTALFATGAALFLGK